MEVPRLMGAREWFAAAVFLLLWSLLLRHLSVYWEANPQYSFGWMVPPIALYSAWRRWVTRPAAQPPAHCRAAALAIFCAALALLPTWLVEQPNPDWRFVSWALAAEIVILSLGTIYIAGGAASVRHFAFPVCFILAAIPWPTAIEAPVIQNLMRFVAGATVTVFDLVGVPAMQHGNVIELGTGMLGIAEACSGVRSLQATVMAALFIGELYRLDFARRFVLLGAAAALAVACNVIRTLALAWVATLNGIDSVARWHDAAGLSVLAVCSAGLWMVALKLTPHFARAAVPRDSNRPLAVPPGLVACLAIWVVFVLAVTEIWYRSHEGVEKQRWWFRWPVSQPGYREVQIADITSAALGFDRGRAAEWRGEDATRWIAFFFEWDAGPARSRILARSHRPEICLPSAGYRFVSEDGTAVVRTDSFEIPFRAFTFDGNGHPVHVFFCAWEDTSGGATTVDWDRLTGIRSVLRGERNLGQRVLEVAIEGYADARAARSALTANLRCWINEKPLTQRARRTAAR